MSPASAEGGVRAPSGKHPSHAFGRGHPATAPDGPVPAAAVRDLDEPRRRDQRGEGEAPTGRATASSASRAWAGLPVLGRNCVRAATHSPAIGPSRRRSSALLPVHDIREHWRTRAHGGTEADGVDLRWLEEVTQHLDIDDGRHPTWPSCQPDDPLC
jgi:hypothetical protein